MKTVEECIKEISENGKPREEMEVLGYLKVIKLPRAYWELLESIATEQNQDVGEVASLYLLNAIARKLFQQTKAGA